MKKLATYAFVAFVLFFAVTQPKAAATATKGIGGFLVTVATGFGEFFSHLLT